MFDLLIDWLIDWLIVQDIPRHLLSAAEGFIIVYSVEDEYSYQVTQVQCTVYSVEDEYSYQVTQVQCTV